MLEDTIAYLRNLNVIPNSNSSGKRPSCKLGDKEGITYKTVNREYIKDNPYYTTITYPFHCYAVVHLLEQAVRNKNALFRLIQQKINKDFISNTEPTFSRSS